MNIRIRVERNSIPDSEGIAYFSNGEMYKAIIQIGVRGKAVVNNLMVDHVYWQDVEIFDPDKDKNNGR